MVFFSQNRTKCANFERKESMKRRIIPSALEIIKRGILPLQMAKKTKDEASTLYNKHRKISLDRCFGESKTPVADILKLPEWREWE